jgi:chromate transporter
MSSWHIPAALPWADWLALFTHFAMLSLLAVGGALTTAPDMQRYVVGERHWISEVQFSTSVALAQAAPGPNVLFVAVLGYNIGGPAGAVATLAGTLLPSSLLTLHAQRWTEAHRRKRGLQAFHAAMAPITIGLLLATAWILFEPAARGWASGLLAAGAAWLALRTKLSPLWPIGTGALAGALGWVG